MFCPKCATQNTEEAKFCRSCGTDISLVPQALSGALAERLADVDDTRRGRRRRHRGDGRPPSIERGTKSLVMGLAFIFIAVIIMTRMPGGSVWGFWMFLPAAGMLADGIANFARIKEERRRLAPPQYQPTQAAVPPPRRASALPPRDTGEIIAPPPSVTEGTTRHLGVPSERPRRDA
jgi:hypothetical protein